MRRALPSLGVLLALLLIAWLLARTVKPVAPPPQPMTAAAPLLAPAPMALPVPAPKKPEPLLRLVDVAPESGARGCLLEGRVFDNGSPVLAARVTLRRLEDFTTMATTSTRTSTSGSFSFDRVRESWYRVSVETDDYLPATVAWQCDASTPTPITLTLVRGDARIRGRVSDEDDNPLADSEVTVVEIGSKRDFPVAAYAEVDREGKFTFTVASGVKLRVFAVAPGYGFVSEDRAPGAGDDIELTLTLPREGWVEGTVTTSAGRPAVGADVGQKGKGMLVGTRTDADGKFAMAVRPGNDLTITARHDGETGRTDIAALTKGETRAGVAITLAPGRTVTGHVEDAELREGIEVLIHEHDGVAGGVLAKAVTDSHGNFSVDGMPAVPLRAIIRGGAPGVAILDVE